MTSQLARPALRRNARWWFLGPLEGKIWLGHHLGPMGFFGTQNPSCCLVTKKNTVKQQKLHKLSDPHFSCWSRESFGSWPRRWVSLLLVCRPSMSMSWSRTSVSFPAVWYWKVKGSSFQDAAEKSWPPRMDTTYVQNSSEYLQCPQPTPRLSILVFFASNAPVGAGLWSSRSYTFLSLSMHILRFVLGPGGLTP